MHIRAPRTIAVLAVLVALCVPAISLRAANDMFLRITTIAGESVDASHTGDIDIQAFSWGVSNSSTAYGAGSGATVAHPQDLTIQKRTDKASPKLMLGTFSSTHYATVTLFVRSRGPNPLEFLKITLTGVAISSFQVSNSADGTGTEFLSLVFSTIRMDYTPLKADGTADTVVTSAWNIATNASF